MTVASRLLRSWLSAVLLALAWWVASTSNLAAHGLAGSLTDFGPEYYLFSRAQAQSARPAASTGALAGPDSATGGVSNGAGADPAPRVAVRLEPRADGTFRVGDVFRLEVKTAGRAFLHLVDFGTSGSVTELLRGEQRPFLEPGGEVRMLDGTRVARWRVQPPPGIEWLLAFAATKPVSLPPDLLTPVPPVGAVRLQRLQAVKHAVIETCRKQGLDVGFLELSFEVVSDGAAVMPGKRATRSPSTYTPEDCYALCVGIERYREQNPDVLPELTCAARDARSFHERLLQSMALPEANTRTLIDEEATYDRIWKELSWLEQQAGPGKCAYLYWSGHGTQALPPKEHDGLTHSALAPHDFICQDYLERQETRLVFDRELGGWLDRLRCDSVVLVVDACYSGAITHSVPGRSSFRPRGFFLPQPGGARAVRWNLGRPTPVNTSRPNVFAIEAAQFDQRAWEDSERGSGLLTRALLERFDEGLAAPVLFQQVKSEVETRAREVGLTQVPNLVNTVRSADFVPFARNAAVGAKRGGR